MKDYWDSASPCTCPPEVIEWFALAVRYAEAVSGNSNPEFVDGARYVKTFLEQPAEVWCGFLSLPVSVAPPEGET